MSGKGGCHVPVTSVKSISGYRNRWYGVLWLAQVKGHQHPGRVVSVTCSTPNRKKKHLINSELCLGDVLFVLQNFIV